ncbi:MAG: glycosyltransferase [Sphingomonadales bacterium]|nr:glycosyltransferase [Sphingomonadales bacterium]
MSAPALSVAMSVHNAGRYLDEAILSILCQSFEDFEFLILDDGSTDDSLALARVHAARDSRIRVIARENRGLIASLNQLLEEARAPLVARMDADDRCRSDRFALQMAFLGRNPDHGLIGANCSYIGPDGAPLARPPLVRALTHDGLLEALESRPTINHNAVIYSRDRVRAVGGYRAAFVHAEDYDLWLRLSQVTKFANLPENLVEYRIYPEQVSHRHLIEQTRNSAIAWLAHRERLAGRPDPVGDSATMPTDDVLDAIFGEGAEAYVQRRVVARSLYAPDALAGEGWPALLRHARRNRRDRELWRLAARMARAGKPAHAGKLGMALLGAG